MPYDNEEILIKSTAQSVPAYKYDEDKIVQEIAEYLASTYSEHYAGNQQIQCFDIWEALGSFETSCRDTAMKYLFRYGRKGGKNRKDLLKAIHYIVMLMHANSKG